MAETKKQRVDGKTVPRLLEAQPQAVLQQIGTFGSLQEDVRAFERTSKELSRSRVVQRRGIWKLTRDAWNNEDSRLFQNDPGRLEEILFGIRLEGVAADRKASVPVIVKIMMQPTDSIGRWAGWSLICQSEQLRCLDLDTEDVTTEDAKWYVQELQRVTYKLMELCLHYPFVRDLDAKWPLWSSLQVLSLKLNEDEKLDWKVRSEAIQQCLLQAVQLRHLKLANAPWSDEMMDFYASRLPVDLEMLELELCWPDVMSSWLKESQPERKARRSTLLCSEEWITAVFTRYKHVRDVHVQRREERAGNNRSVKFVTKDGLRWKAELEWPSAGVINWETLKVEGKTSVEDLTLADLRLLLATGKRDWQTVELYFYPHAQEEVRLFEVSQKLPALRNLRVHTLVVHDRRMYFKKQIGSLDILLNWFGRPLVRLQLQATFGSMWQYNAVKKSLDLRPLKDPDEWRTEPAEEYELYVSGESLGTELAVHVNDRYNLVSTALHHEEQEDAYYLRMYRALPRLSIEAMKHENPPSYDTFRLYALGEELQAGQLRQEFKDWWDRLIEIELIQALAFFSEENCRILGSLQRLQRLRWFAPRQRLFARNLLLLSTGPAPLQALTVGYSQRHPNYIDGLQHAFDEKGDEVDTSTIRKILEKRPNMDTLNLAIDDTAIRDLQAIVRDLSLPNLRELQLPMSEVRASFEDVQAIKLACRNLLQLKLRRILSSTDNLWYDEVAKPGYSPCSEWEEQEFRERVVKHQWTLDYQVIKLQNTHREVMLIRAPFPISFLNEIETSSLNILQTYAERSLEPDTLKINERYVWSNLAERLGSVLTTRGQRSDNGRFYKVDTIHWRDWTIFILVRDVYDYPILVDRKQRTMEHVPHFNYNWSSDKIDFLKSVFPNELKTFGVKDPGEYLTQSASFNGYGYESASYILARIALPNAPRRWITWWMQSGSRDPQERVAQVYHFLCDTNASGLLAQPRSGVDAVKSSGDMDTKTDATKGVTHLIQERQEILDVDAIAQTEIQATLDSWTVDTDSRDMLRVLEQDISFDSATYRFDAQTRTLYIHGASSYSPINRVRITELVQRLSNEISRPLPFLVFD